MGKSAIDAFTMDEKGLSWYLAMMIFPRHAIASLKDRPWISLMHLLIGKGMPSRETVG
jgi:hypothetical protein